MPRGYRLLVVALGLILAAQHPNVGAQPKQSSPQERSASALENIAARYDEQAEGVQRSPEGKPCNSGDDKRNSDLCAQWKAADAAADAARWASWGTWFTGVSTVLVVIALGLTLQSNLIAREGIEGQLRPWLNVSAAPTIGFKFVQDEGMTYFEYVTNVVIQNLGASPAIDTSYLTTFVFYEPTPSQLRANVDTWFGAHSNDWNDKNIFPTEVWKRKSGAVHLGDAPGDSAASLILAVRYKTPFSNRWRFSVKVYSLGNWEGERQTLSIPTTESAAGLGKAWFQDHPRNAGIAT